MPAASAEKRKPRAGRPARHCFPFLPGSTRVLIVPASPADDTPGAQRYVGLEDAAEAMLIFKSQGKGYFFHFPVRIACQQALGFFELHVVVVLHGCLAEGRTQNAMDVGKRKPEVSGDFTHRDVQVILVSEA
jgi:hypothetical protein